VFQTDVIDFDKPSDTGTSRISSIPWLERVERALIYVGAFGLGVGHGLVPQVLLLLTAVYRLIADPEFRRVKFGSVTMILLVLTGWMMLSAIPAIRPSAAWGGALGMALSGWVTLGVVYRVMIDKKDRGKNLILVFLGSACIGAIYALVNYASALAKGRGYYRAALPFVGTIPFDSDAVKAINDGLTIVDMDCASGRAVRKIYSAVMELLFEGGEPEISAVGGDEQKGGCMPCAEGTEGGCTSCATITEGACTPCVGITDVQNCGYNPLKELLNKTEEQKNDENSCCK